MPKKRWEWILVAACFVVGVILLVSALQHRPTKPKLTPVKAVPTQLDRIELKLRELDDRTRRIEELNTTETPPKWVPQSSFLEHIRRQRIVNRGGDIVDRIESYLARNDSPMQGHGRDFYVAAIDAGLPPLLSVAIAKQESGLGKATPPGSNNPYGMTAGTAPGYASVSGRGPDGTRGYQAFPDWETAIYEHAAFIRRHWGPVSSPYDMHGYAEDGAWAAGVARAMESI